MEFAALVSSQSYKNAAMEYVVTQFDQMCGKEWEERFLHISKTLFNAHKQVSLSFEELLKDTVTSPEVPPSRLRDSENPQSGEYSALVASNAVYNAVYCRFLSVVVDEGEPGTCPIHTDAEMLVTDIEALGLPVLFKRSGLVRTAWTTCLWRRCVAC